MNLFAPITWSRSPGRWLFITGVIELVVGAGLFAVGWVLPGVARGSLWLTGGILGLVGVGLLVWGWRWSARYAEAQRLRVHGVPGQAAIVAMHQTGVTLNHQPQVELTLSVQVAGRPPYAVTVTEYVPLLMLGRLASGAPLPVKIDPTNPENLVIEWESTASPAGLGALAPPVAAGASDRVKQRILSTGVTGMAKILQSTPTGQTDAAGHPVHHLVLQIEIDGRPSLTGAALAGIPPERAARLETGDVVPVRADPADPTQIAIDWVRA